MIKKYTRNGLNIPSIKNIETTCIKYQLLTNVGVKHINPLMIPYIDFSRKSTKFFSFDKYFIGLVEFIIFFKNLFSSSKNLQILVVSLLSKETVPFIADFALRQKWSYSLGFWQSGILTNFKKPNATVGFSDEFKRFDNNLIIDIPELIILFNTKGGNKILNEALKCSIPVVSISDANSDPRVLVNLPGDGSSPLTCYFYCKLLESLASNSNELFNFTEDTLKYNLTIKNDKPAAERLAIEPNNWYNNVDSKLQVGQSLTTKIKRFHLLKNQLVLLRKFRNIVRLTKKKRSKFRKFEDVVMSQLSDKLNNSIKGTTNVDMLNILSRKTSMGSILWTYFFRRLDKWNKRAFALKKALVKGKKPFTKMKLKKRSKSKVWVNSLLKAFNVN